MQRKDKGMKTEDLKEKGLTQEQIDFVMAENGKDVEAVKSDVTSKQTEIDALNSQLTDLNKEIKAFKDMNIDEVKAKVTELEGKKADLEKELKETRESALLDKALSSINTHDADVVKGLLKKDELVFKEGEVVGFDSQIENLKKEKPYLFKEDGEGDKKPQFTKSTGGGNAGEGNKPVTLTDAIRNLYKTE